jgi:cytochrome bd ubiquinol oxidase subunit II
MSGADLLAFVALGCLVLYTLLGGADFGGGVWDLLATGPRARAQRTLIERAIAPIWEANHVWLIIIVTILFAAFPPAFSVIFTALHVPPMLVLVGIVLRGSTFVFRQYGAPDDVTAHRLGRVFAVTSTITPVFLGVCLGAITGERIRVEKGVPVTGFFEPWAGLFPFTVGLLALCAFAFLAATYLIHEAGDDADLREDFRRRALASGVATALCAVLGAVLARGAAPRFFAALTSSGWSLPVVLGAGATFAGAMFTLTRRHLHAARALAVVSVTLVVLGWGLAHRPYLVAPDVTIDGAAAPPNIVRLVLWLVLAGALLVFPSLYVMLRVFKRRRDGEASPG